MSPERALEQLTRVQHPRIRIAQGGPVTGVSAINAKQAGVFSALGVKKPAASQQLSLLSKSDELSVSSSIPPCP